MLSWAAKQLLLVGAARQQLDTQENLPPPRISSVPSGLKVAIRVARFSISPPLHSLFLCSKGGIAKLERGTKDTPYYTKNW